MTTIDPRITDRVATCVGTLLALTPPTTKVFITDTVCSSTLVLLAPGDVSRTSRYGTTPCNRDVVVRYPRDNRTILIGIIVFPPTIGNSGSQDILKKRQSTSPSVGTNAQTVNTSVDGNLANDGDSTSIFRKLLGRKL